jgi:hypothetical protein
MIKSSIPQLNDLSIYHQIHKLIVQCSRHTSEVRQGLPKDLVKPFATFLDAQNQHASQNTRTTTLLLQKT